MARFTRTAALISVLVGATLAAAPPAAGQVATAPTYTYVDLGVLPGAPATTSSSATDVNASGAVVGTSGSGRFGAASAFLRRAGNLIALGAISDGPYASSFGSAVNDAGNVVGYTHVNRTDPPHAFVVRAGRMTDLGTGGGAGSWSAARDINEAGLVVGARRSAAGAPTRATSWSGSTIVDLPGLGGASEANAVNDAGQAVGVAWTAAGVGRGVLWQAGRVQDLGTLGDDQEATVATDVSNTGTVVGRSVTASRQTHAFAWRAGALRDLGTLGTGYSTARGVNDAGQVVGASLVAGTPRGNAGHAVLWQDGRIVDLNRQVVNLPSDVVLETASAINNSGIIVGTTCTAFCEPGKTAPTRGFMLVPVA